MYKNRLEFPMTPAGGFGNSVKNNFVSGHFFSLSFAGTDTKCWGLLFSLAFWRHGECVYKSNFPRFFFIFNARHRKDIVAGLYKVPVCMRTANTENLNLHFLVPQFFFIINYDSKSYLRRFYPFQPLLCGLLQDGAERLLASGSRRLWQEDEAAARRCKG